MITLLTLIGAVILLVLLFPALLLMHWVLRWSVIGALVGLIGSIALALWAVSEYARFVR